MPVNIIVSFGLFCSGQAQQHRMVGSGHRQFADSAFTNPLRDIDSYKKIKCEPIVSGSISPVTNNLKSISQCLQTSQGKFLNRLFKRTRGPHELNKFFKMTYR